MRCLWYIEKVVNAIILLMLYLVLALPYIYMTIIMHWDENIMLPRVLIRHTSEDGWDSSIWRTECVAYQSYGANFYNQLRALCRAYAHSILHGIPVTEDFKQFLMRRGEWMASGSAGGPRSVASLPDGSRVKLNKRGWAERTTIEEIVTVLRGNEPAEIAAFAEKYENGKARALYAVEPFHYIITTFATNLFEENMYRIEGLEKGATGLLAAKYLLKRCAISLDANQHLSMLDFADFNIQHSPLAQAMLYEQIAQEGKELGCHPDWVKCNEWLESVGREKKCYDIYFNGVKE